MSRNIKQGGSIRRLASRAVPLMAVVVLVAAVSAGTLGSRPDEAGAIPQLTMGVDVGQDGTSGGGASLALGSKRQVDLRVDSLGLILYQAYQFRVRYDDSKLDLTLPHNQDANNSWPGSGDPVGVLQCADTEPVEDDTGTEDWLGFCQGNAGSPYSSYMGVLHTLEFECESSGDASIQLIAATTHDTGLVDDSVIFQVPDIVVNDTITCESPPGPIADKGVLGIVFDDATKTWPGPGPVIPDNHMDIDASLDGSQQYIVSVTSKDALLDGEPPLDSWVGFYADIPAGCYGYWLPDDPALDTRTMYGDPFAYPDVIPDPDQIGTPVPWAMPKQTGVDPPYSAGGPFEADIHFQTRAYGLYEEVGVTLPLTRYFEFHCDEPSEHVFTFCNKIEPKPPWEDPDIVDPGRWPTYPGQPGDNVLCEDLTVEVWAEVDIQAGVAGFGDGVVRDASCFSAPPASIPVNQDVDLCLGKYFTHPGPNYLINPGVDILVTPPPGCTLPVDPSGSWSLENLPQGEFIVYFQGFTINCSQAGYKAFTIYDSWDLDEPEDEHVTDPDPTNNDGQFDWPVDVFPQDPTFSIAGGSPSAPNIIDAADLLVRQPGGTWPPAVVYPCPAFGLAFCGSMGHFPYDEVNALSLGQDFTLPPPDPANPDAYLYFSVAPGATGVATTGVNNETVGAGCMPEPEADEFGSDAAGSNYQFFDGDGVASCANPAAPALGLLEPPMALISDDLDALDPLNLTATGPPIYVSLDQASPTLPFFPGSAADIFWDPGGGISWWYATAAQLGLDTAGMNRDDIDALCILDDGNWVYDPGVDTVWFSLTAGSASLGKNSPADVFAAPYTGVPVVTAGQLGLLTTDELNALKCYEEAACTPPFTDLGLPEPDSDCDGAPDDAELGPDPSSCGTRDPNDPWDFYNVPVPTLGRGGDMYDRDSAVTILSDVLGVLEYSGTSDEGPPNTVPRDYDDDDDGDGYDDGMAYDRTVSTTGPWSGPPDGAIIILTDVLLVLMQSGHSC